MQVICGLPAHLTTKDDVNVNLTPRHFLFDERSGHFWGVFAQFFNGEEWRFIPRKPLFCGVLRLWYAAVC